MSEKKDQLWDLLNKIWEKGDNRSDFVKKCNDYWNGNLHKNYRVFSDQDKTAFNIIKPIIETKLKAVLDTQFTLAVTPKVNCFSTLSTLKDHQAVADIYNEELLNILSNNKMELKNETICRTGLKCGFGTSQTTWSNDDSEIGEINITSISSENLKWDKDATGIDDATFIGYSFTLNPAEAKNRYCRNEDGSFDETKCKKIDKISTSKNENKKDVKRKGVISYQTNQGGGQAYAQETDGILAGKSIDLICMFLLDDSLYAPKENDTKEEENIKDESIAKYPNGRMVIFSKNEKEKLILEDVAAPESFKHLGNIDIFNPIYDNNIAGKGEVEDLFTTQDRIDGLYNKYRKELNNNIDAIVVSKKAVGDNNWVDHPVIFLENDDKMPVAISNNGLDNATKALSMIEQLENHAGKMGRINETMLYGHRQTGTTSGEQVEMLQESPLADIRSITRNYKDFLISVGNKCIKLIQNNYTVDRLIKLTTGMTEGQYAKLQTNLEDEQEMVIINEAGETVKSIKMNPDWEFQVEVSAGTEVPRSRRENAQLMNTLVDKGIFNLKDPDMVEQYLRSLDVPNYRLLTKILRDKQAQQQEQQEAPEAKNWTELLKNTEISKEFSTMFDKLAGYPLAQQQMLKEVGLIPAPGKLDTMPVNEITSQSDVSEVMTLVPGQISNDPIKVAIGRDAAIAEQLTDTIK